MNETSTFPLAPAPFTGESREVDAGACFDWLRQGWAMFLANPGVWIGCTVLLLVILMAISIVPLFGQIAAHLLVPLFGAGMIQICRHLSEGREPDVADLFVGFRHQAGQLVMVGVFFAAGVFGIAFIAFLLVTGGVFGGVVTGRVAGFGIALGGVMLASLMVMVLSVPVIMATWFAPVLVFLHGMQPWAAMKASFAAGAKNWLAMMIFGVFLVVVLFFAMLPLGLGLLLFLPVFSGAVYASYRDIFVGA
ncbi:MAG: putative transrane protein [Proteobacteria bacterium]|nr:putative transrane protein [Pseudomonadota bacterium]